MTNTAKFRAFSAEGIKANKYIVEADGTIRVWDAVAKHYTTCHCVSAATARRLRKLAIK